MKSGSSAWSQEETCWNALLGRGLNPYSLWLLTVGLPSLLLFWNLRQDESTKSWLLWILAAVIAGWTLPLETLGMAIVHAGKFRCALADIVPVLPSVGMQLPKLIKVAYPIMPQILPHMSELWPHMHLILPHAEFLTRIIPKLSSRIEDLIPLVEKVAPQFGKFTPQHMAKLELIIDDVIIHLDCLLPHIDQLMPILAEGLLVVNPTVLKHIEEIVPYLDALEKDLNWLLPFAEIEGVEDLLPLMDIVAPKIQKIQPFAAALAPLIPKIRPLLPHIVNNMDVLMDELNKDVVDNLDPMLYWCGRFLPLADSMGILHSHTLLRAFMPMGRYLPRVPCAVSVVADTRNDTINMEWWRRSLCDRSITIAGHNIVQNIVYYRVHVDSKYAGEFRYRDLYELHLSIRSKLYKDTHAPRFPPRMMYTLTAHQIVLRERQLEAYLAYIMLSLIHI